MRQPKWDKYESALLLEAVLNVDTGKEDRKGAINRISSTLRQLAVNKGLPIDGTYRNVNGITFQLQSMEAVALGKQNQMQKNGSKIFEEVVALYRDNTTEYNRILAAAHANADLDLSTKNVNDSLANNIEHSIAVNQRTVNLDVIKAFDLPTKAENVLIEHFRRGFRPTSIMDRNRFIALYERKYNVVISVDDVIKEVQKCCFKFDDRFFLPKALVDKDIAVEIARYISEYFSQKEILFYNVLYSAFEDKFDSFIYSAEMLVAFLQKVLIGTTIYYSDRFCSIKEKAVPDITSEIIDYLIKMDAPCSYDMIYGHFSHLNQGDIYNVLHYNNPEILGNSKVEYFHVKTAQLTESELAVIKSTTETLLVHSKFITCNEIMKNLEQISPALMERLSAKYTRLGIRRIFTYYLRINYDVETGIVTKKGMKMTVVDAFADFAQTHKTFTIEDVQAFAEYTGTVPYWDTVHKYAVRINATDFVSDSDINFDVDAIDSAIDYYCADYIALCDIPDYSRFPSCGVAWNIYLLQQYVYRFSKQFKLLSLGFAKGNVAGVIARKQSRFDDFDSVVVDVLEHTKISSPNEAIQHLCDRGIVAEKRYKKHVDLLKIAIARRNNR